MNIGGMSLEIGDSIKYVKHGDMPSTRIKHREGIITHMTDKIITVNLGKYRDSFSFNDLTDKTVEVEGMGKVELQTDEVYSPYRPDKGKIDIKYKRVIRSQSEYRLKGKNINWKKLWPVVKEEMENGAKGIDIAKKYDISHDALRKQIQKIRREADTLVV